MVKDQTKDITKDRIRQSKRRIMMFAIACAWADLELSAQEIRVLYDVADEIALDASMRAEIPRWLEKPPEPEEVDPGSMSPLEASMCLVVARRIIEADGKWSDEEVVLYNILRELFAPVLSKSDRRPQRRADSRAA